MRIERHDAFLNSENALDIVRAMRLTERGYRIWTQAIPAEITPKNRLLLGAPVATGAVR